MSTSPILNSPRAADNPEQLARLRTTLAGLLKQGDRFTIAEPDPGSAADLRGWLDRTRHIVGALAEHLEAPSRAAVLATIDHPALDQNSNALAVLRVNIAGCSPNQLGEEVGVTGNTVRRLEDPDTSCNASTAKKLSDRFGLRVLELFTETSDDDLIVRTVGQLRETLVAT